jgi:hypothetical protein
LNAKDVIWGRDPLIADLLCHLGKFPQGRRLTADINNRKGHAELHLRLHWVPFLCASIVSTSLLPDYTNRGISAKHDED